MISIVPSMLQNLHLGSMNVDLGRLVSWNTKGISTSCFLPTGRYTNENNCIVLKSHLCGANSVFALVVMNFDCCGISKQKVD